MKMTPTVSIILVTKNEEKYIAKCLNSIQSQNFPKERLEVLIIDSVSEDNTIQKINVFLNGKSLEIRQEIINKEGGNTINNIRILQNQKRIVPSGLNIGIKEAKGDYIIRMDAHTEYASDYITKCVKWLEKTEAESVGGPMRATGRGYVGKAIELAHHSFFGLGGGRFHDEKWFGYVDTVYLGAFRQDVFDKVGVFDERLIRNQDIEFNARIRKNGGKIFLTPEIKSFYHCRNTLKGLWKQNFENGKWIIYTKKLAPYCLSWRHFIPFAFVLSLLSSLLFSVYFSLAVTSFFILASSYIFTNLFFSVLLSVRNGPKYFFILPIVFATLHFSYGFGSILGLLTLRRCEKQNSPAKE